MIVSNSWLYNCGNTGIIAEEGSSVNVINCHISDCSDTCVTCDNVSNINILGSMLSDSGAQHSNFSKNQTSGVLVKDRSKGNISRCLLQRHKTAVSCDNADLVMDENCVMDIVGGEGENLVTEAGLQLENSAIFICREQSCYEDL